MLIDFLSGALMMSFLVATAYFVRFWQRTSDRLFLYFAIAFALLALNQVALFAMGTENELRGYVYVLRVSGFILILVGILGKNVRRAQEDRK
ncbi:MAG: DUF5985 family protein [Rhodospirillaceae bacterium]